MDFYDYDYYDYGVGSTGMAFIVFISITIIVAIIAISIASYWRIFVKAGRPGWNAIVPIYNSVIQCRISGISPLWVIALFLPVANIEAYVWMMIRLGDVFGKDVPFKIGLILLPCIFLPVLAFDNSTYRLDNVALMDNLC